MLYQKVMLHLAIIISFLVPVSSLFPCHISLQQDGNYNVVTCAKRIFTPQSLLVFCCKSFVRNSQSSMEQQLTSDNNFPYPDNVAKGLVSAAIVLPKEDEERVNKIITILKKMPLAFYSDFAFLINRQKESQIEDMLSGEEKKTILTVLKYLPNLIDETRIAIINFFVGNYLFPQDLIRAAFGNDVSYQIVEILLKNGIKPDPLQISLLIPSTVEYLDTENCLKKIALVFERLNSNLKEDRMILTYKKNRAIRFLKIWKKNQIQTDSEYTHSPETVEKSVEFYSDVIKLIELYENQEDAKN